MGILAAQILLIGFVSVACVNDKFTEEFDNIVEDRIHVSAVIIPEYNTRDYYGSSETQNVESGTFYFTYPRVGNETSSNAIYELAYVDFGEEESPGTGFIYYFDNEERKDLTWKKVWNEGRTKKQFYLHNINPNWFTYGVTSDRKDTNQKYIFNSTSPYKASPLDKENGSNDLLSAKSLAVDNSVSNINFTLEHRLSLLKLNIEVFASETDSHLISLENAKVKISNLYTRLNTFNLYFPTSFSTKTENYFNTISNKATTSLIDPEVEGLSWDKKETGDFTGQDGQTYIRTVYSIPEFVFPPQTPETSTWPIVTVEVPKEDVTGSPLDQGDYVIYKGLIPTIMFNVASDGSLSPTPVATALSTGYQLTLTATINSPNTEIQFLPAQVEKWVDKGTFPVSSKQAGIYNINDWNNMVQAYKDGNNIVLEKYGYIGADGKLVLQLWASLTMEKNSVINCMRIEDEERKIPFDFMFNGYNVALTIDAVEDEILTGSSGQISLYNFVTGEELPQYSGINSLEVLNTVMEICSDPETELSSIKQYGTLNNSDNTITFEINGTFKIKFEDIFKKFPSKLWNYDLDFVIQGDNIVTVDLVEDDGESENNTKIVCKSTDPYNIFSRLAVTYPTSGIKTASDFNFLLDCYNKYYKYQNNILSLFGTQNAARKWTFKFLAAMTLEGERAFLGMIPDAGSNRPEYGLESSYTISFTSSILSSFTAKNASNVYQILSGSGKASTYYSLSSIAFYYENNDWANLWTNGKFENGKWTFTLTYGSKTQSISWNNLFGKMIPNDKDKKYEYSFDLVDSFYELTDVPVSKGSSITETKRFRGEEGANALKHIALGNYWEWLENQE